MDFQILLETHQALIEKVTRYYANDHDDHRDLVQDVVIEIWKSAEKFENRSNIKTWIYRIALNVSISRIRKNQKHKLVSYVDDWATLSDSTSSTDSTTNCEDIKLLNHFIAELDDVNKAIMILYLEELSYDEIAAHIGISNNNVGVRINRIKKLLTIKFKEHEH